MSQLASRRIVLGVSGGIAAYKSVDLCRRLIELGAHVVPVMTDDAHRFIGPVTLSALASEPVHTSLWDDASVIPHTKLGQTADIVVVAPATARVLSAYATGSSEDLLTATLIATRAPVVVCPAMHTEMWEHAAVQENIKTLRRRGVHVVEPEIGKLAGGDVGAGRLASTDSICAEIIRVLELSHDLAGIDIVVTAGGTREPIDAVRVISNRSSGKQGYAVATVAAQRGARVTLITTVDRAVPAGVLEIQVETAQQMKDAVDAAAVSADVVIMAAAVADFRPVICADQKLKKADGIPNIVLESTPDILAGLGQRKPVGQILVGFAAETDSLVAHAKAKLTSKCLDLIVANDVSAPGVGFGHDTNAVVILSPNAPPISVALADKHTVAHALLDSVVKVRRQKQETK